MHFKASPDSEFPRENLMHVFLFLYSIQIPLFCCLLIFYFPLGQILGSIYLLPVRFISVWATYPWARPIKIPIFEEFKESTILAHLVFHTQDTNLGSSVVPSCSRIPPRNRKSTFNPKSQGGFTVSRRSFPL